MGTLTVDLWFPCPYVPQATGCNDWQERTNQMVSAILEEAKNQSCEALGILFNAVSGENPQWTDNAIAVIAFGDRFYLDVPDDKLPRCPVLAITSGKLKSNWFRWYYSARLIGFTLARMIVRSENYAGTVLLWMESHLGRCVAEEFSRFGLDDAICFPDTATTDDLENLIDKIVSCTKQHRVKTFAIVGYGDAYEYILNSFSKNDDLRHCRLLTDPNFTVFQGSANVKTAECVTGLYRENQNVFETFCRRAVSLICNYSKTNNGGRLTFGNYLLSLRFHKLDDIGIVNFREDGELFLPLRLYFDGFSKKVEAREIVESNHPE